MQKRPWKSPVVSAIALVSLALAWILFAPVQLGGKAVYVILSGNSMEPDFHLGDLVIVKADEPYQLNDIVAYTHPEIGPVFHRIVKINQGTYELKGDNNSWEDSYKPTEDEIIGRLWEHLPRAGKIVLFLRQPVNFVLLVVGVVTLTFFPGISNKHKASSKYQLPGNVETSMNMIWRNEKYQEQLFVIATLSLVAIVLGFVSFSRPTTQISEEVVLFDHTGEFQYSASGVLGLYDQLNAKTGDPVFLNVSDEVLFDFIYSMSGEQISSVKGSYTLNAQVSEESGWKRTIELQEETTFEGPIVEISGLLKLESLNRVITIYQNRTGIKRSDFIVSIIPQIQIEAIVAGENISDTFVPKLQFRMDQFQLSLLQLDEGNLLNSVQGSSFETALVEANTIPIFNFELRVLTARWISALLLVVVLVYFGYSYWNYIALAKQGESAQINAYFDDLILPAAEKPKNAEMVQLDRFGKLAALAANNNQMIKLFSTRGKDYYFVQLLDETYFYLSKEPLEEKDG